MAAKAKATAKPVSISISSTDDEGGIGSWLTRKAGDAVIVGGEASGEITGAFEASGEAFSAARQVSRKTRIQEVRARAIARASRAGITLTFE